MKRLRRLFIRATMRPCHPEVYSEGHIVATMTPHLEGRAYHIEEWLQDFKNMYPGYRMDWHYFGGKPVIKVICGHGILTGFHAVLNKTEPPEHHSIQVPSGHVETSTL